MRLALITDEVSQDLEAAAGFAVDHGVEWVAIRSAWGRNVAEMRDDDLDRIRQVLSHNGLRASAVLSPLFKCGPRRTGGVARDGDEHFTGYALSREENLRAAPALRRTASLLGAEVMRLFTFLTEIPGSTVPAEAETDIDRVTSSWPRDLAAFENEAVCHVRSLSDLAVFCARGNRRAVLDPCNEYVALGTDGLDDLDDELVSRTVDIHVKDRRRSDFVPAGRGELRWPAIIDRLREAGYKGFVTIESHLRGDLAGISESVCATRKWLAA